MNPLCTQKVFAAKLSFCGLGPIDTVKGIC